MTTTHNSPGITFAVDDVTPAASPLPTIKAYEAIKSLLGTHIESCSDYHGEVVQGLSYHGVLAAVYRAHADHRPLVLTPDALWITIAQGIAHHMAIRGEALRSRFVTHSAKKQLLLERTDLARGSPENPWPEIFAGWSTHIRGHVGAKLHDLLVCDFSTTGPIERAASEIVLIDIFETYFESAAVGICGIPRVTLEGSVADWQKLRQKIEALDQFDMGWWLAHLRLLCDEFIAAASGTQNRTHWQNICKLTDAYGGDIINGWIAKLFPYLRETAFGPVTRLNPIFETGAGFQTFVAPSGLSSVPVVWMDFQGRRLLHAIGGIIGVAQDRITKALRPQVGWAVCPALILAQVIGRIRSEHIAEPPPANFSNEIPFDAYGMKGLKMRMPAGMGGFYHDMDGARLFAHSQPCAFRLVPRRELHIKVVATAGRPSHRVRFCELADGRALWAELRGQQRDNILTENGEPVAASFEEFLRKALDSGGTYWW